jgi:hypothetical protein
MKKMLIRLFDITTTPKIIYSKPAPKNPLLCLPVVGRDGMEGASPKGIKELLRC